VVIGLIEDFMRPLKNGNLYLSLTKKSGI